MSAREIAALQTEPPIDKTNALQVAKACPEFTLASL